LRWNERGKANEERNDTHGSAGWSNSTQLYTFVKVSRGMLLRAYAVLLLFHGLMESRQTSRHKSTQGSAKKKVESGQPTIMRAYKFLDAHFGLPSLYEKGLK
jgi:hypothetical protein